MSDNTQLNQATVGSGDTIRTIARPSGVKTEVVSLDVGGDAASGNSPEQLVTAQFGLPVQDPYTQVTALIAAQEVALQSALAQGGFYPVEVPGFLVGLPG